jgi:hypothetical protein
MYGSQMYATRPAPQTYAPQGIFGGLGGGQLGRWIGGEFGHPDVGSVIGSVAGSFLPFQAGPQGYAPQGVAPQAAGAVSPQWDWGWLKDLAENVGKSVGTEVLKQLPSLLSAGPQGYAPQGYMPQGVVPQAAGAVSPQWDWGWLKDLAEKTAKSVVEKGISSLFSAGPQGYAPQGYAPQGVAPQAAGAVSPQGWGWLTDLAEKAAKYAVQEGIKQLPSLFSAGPQGYAPQGYAPQGWVPRP